RAARAAVAAVRSAQRLELLAVHGGDTVPAAAGADVQRHPVDEGRDRHSSVLLSVNHERRPSGAPSVMSCVDDSGVVTRDDVDDPAAPAGAELHRARGEREQRVVATAADVGAGVEVGAALADDDLAGVDDLAAVAL